MAEVRPYSLTGADGKSLIVGASCCSFPFLPGVRLIFGDLFIIGDPSDNTRSICAFATYSSVLETRNSRC